ncbi:MAG: hypothetical protein L3J51_08270 [Cocleimonas sp.]|nr:hypothetical protein [Cocleimonas sp.]
MTRLLILIIALNAFITPVSAVGVCEMMENTGLSANNISSNSMPEMDCSECEDDSCDSMPCGISSSAVTMPILLSEKLSFNIVAGNHQPQTDLAYFYTITYPVNTPPPLV